jgi:ATP-dependent 26S proteasome regulatory subunit
MLDSAAWRRFDEIVHFPLPDFEMRKSILDIVTRHIEGAFSTGEIAELTDGYSGSDLRMVIREAVLNALLEERKILTQQDLLVAVDSFNERAGLKSEEYYDTKETAELTESDSDLDLRTAIMEVVLDAFMEERKTLTKQDLLKAVESYNERTDIKSEKSGRKKQI